MNGIGCTLRNILTSHEEWAYTNKNLEQEIAVIKQIMDENPALVPEGESAIRTLQHRINTNLHYVEKKRSENPIFSLPFTVKTDDIAGTKFLLRVGEDPNQKLRGKTAAQIAAVLEKKEILKLFHTTQV